MKVFSAIVFFGFLFVSTHALNQTDQIISIVNSEVILKDSSEIKVSKWEDSLFSTKEIKCYSFKSRKPLTGYKDIYFRFLMYTYTFDDTTHAQKKLEDIDLAPPRMRHLYYKSFPMGFRTGKTVFVFMTDAVIFKSSLTTVYQKICASLGAVCDAE